MAGTTHADGTEGVTRSLSAGGEMPVWLAYAFLLVTAMSWAASSVAGRAAAGNVPPYTLSFIRWAAAFLVFLPFGAKPLWRQRQTLYRHFPLMMAFSLFGVVGFTVPYYIGLQYTPAVNASLLNGLGPVMILALAYLMLGVKVTPAQGVGIVLAIVGSVAIVLRGEFSTLLALQINIGDMLVMVSFFSWSMYTVMLNWRPGGLDQSSFLVALCGLASAMMLPMYIWELVQGKTFEATTGNLAIIGYAALFPSAIAYVCWNAAVKRLGASRASVTQYLIPVFGVLLAVLLLGENVRWFHLFGIACIFTGVYLASAAKRRAG